MSIPTEVQAPYTIAEVSTLMALSPRVVTTLFEREPGVLIFESKSTTRRKRKHYRTIRIPRHVYERVVRRHTV